MKVDKITSQTGVDSENKPALAVAGLKVAVVLANNMRKTGA